MKIHVQAGKKARIEMLPLIDIVFLLLVFFINAMLSMAVHHGLSVELPVSSSARLDKRTTVSITVDARANIFLDKQPVELSDLTDVLRKKTNGQQRTGVLLFADRSLSYQHLFRVLDRIKMAGLENISLQAETDI